MDKIVRIPVRVVGPRNMPLAPGASEPGGPLSLPAAPVQAPIQEPPGTSAAAETPGPGGQKELAQPEPGTRPASAAQVEPGAPIASHDAGKQVSTGEWRDLALRLQAEMENCRKRQERLAQEQIRAERERLLQGFLRVVDDLERALAAGAASVEELRRGVELVHRSALLMLEREGVTPFQSESHEFDPNWHEAVATVESEQAGALPGTVAQVAQTGYRLDGRLLRPARVVVAV